MTNPFWQSEFSEITTPAFSSRNILSAQFLEDRSLGGSAPEKERRGR